MNRSIAAPSQNVRWLRRPPRPTVLLVDDQQREFKRAFASALLQARAHSKHGSQKEVAKLVGTSVATYARWEGLDDMNMPDAWEINRLCEHLACEADDLINPLPLNGREQLLAKRAARASARGVRRAASGE